MLSLEDITVLWGLLTLNLIVLKLIGVIHWHWVWVLLPLWAVCAAAMVLVGAFIIHVIRQHERNT